MNPSLNAPVFFFLKDNQAAGMNGLISEGNHGCECAGEKEKHVHEEDRSETPRFILYGSLQSDTKFVSDTDWKKERKKVTTNLKTRGIAAMQLHLACTTMSRRMRAPHVSTYRRF